VVNLAGGVSTIDPAQACTGFDVSFTGNFYARLTQYGTRSGPDGTQEVDPGKIEPWFAKSWDVSKDGLTYTFKLHEGVKFPSGGAMDAAAVKYSFERVIKNKGCGAYFLLDGYQEPPLITAISAPDPATVVIKLRQPNQNALQDWAQAAAGIVDPTVVEANGGVKSGEVNKWMAGNVAGSGPFLLESYEPNSKAVLAANPAYFDKAPASKKITVNFIGADSTLQLQASSGAADVTLGLSKQSATKLAKGDSTRIVANDTSQSLQVRLATNKAPLNNTKVREALFSAVPYEDILSKVALGYGTLFDGPFAPLIPEYNAELGKPRTFDAGKAKQLLQESGVATPLTLELIINGEVPTNVQIGTILQGVWKEIGVNLTISKLSISEFTDRNRKGDFDLSITQDGPGVVEGGFYLGYAMGCTGAFSGSSVCIPGGDELLAKARRAIDKDERQRLYDQITRLWIGYSPMIQLYAEKTITVLNKRVKNYTYSQLTDMRTWSK
jgi:peptide/nickel transport system substrate-binding protein